MQRIHATDINPHTENNVLVMVMGLQGIGNKPAWEACDIKEFLKELVTIKYFMSVDLIDQVFVSSRMIHGNLANLLRASIDFIHQVLVHVDPYEYTPENIELAICRHPDLICKLMKAFEYKFHPEKNSIKKYRQLRDECFASIQTLDTGKEDIDERHRNVFNWGSKLR